MPLYRHELGKALFFRQGVGLTQLPGEAVGDADVACLALLHHLVQAVQDVIEGRLVVPHVVDVQVYMVHAQILQALLQQTADMLLAGDACLDLLVGAGQELSGDHDLVPPGKIPQGTAQILLTGAALIADGGVKEVDAQLQPALHDFSGMLLINGPGMLAVVCIAKAHTPHTDPGYR